VPTVKLAAAIVVHDDSVLVVQRSMRERFLPGVWGVPCGKVDVALGERSRQAALRELLEETGLEAEVICFAGRSKFVSDWRGVRTRNVQRNYLVRPILEQSPEFEDECLGATTDLLKVELPEEDQKYAWVAKDTIAAFGLDAHNLGAIRQALRVRHPGMLRRIVRRLISLSEARTVSDGLNVTRTKDSLGLEMTRESRS
jgi:8-oxo-dGTP diphosphatase